MHAQLPDDEDVDGARGRQDPEYNDRLIMDTLENMGVRSAELAMEVRCCGAALLQSLTLCQSLRPAQCIAQ